MYYVGVDIGGMSIKCAFMNENGEVSNRFFLPIIKEEPQDSTLARIGNAINENIQSSEMKKEDFVGVGIGCPGSINTITGVCEFAGNLGWEHAPIRDVVSKITGLPVKVTNDANAAMLGEAKFGVGKEYNNLVLLTLGTGVGGGLFINGKLFEGNEGKGAELGHMIIEKGGRQCTCGLRGCLETYASATALIKETKKAMYAHRESDMWGYCEADIEKVTGRTVFDCARNGDATAKEVLDEYGEYLALGIANFCNIFRPDAIILGGGLSNAGKELTDPVEKHLKAIHYGFKGTPAVKILIASLKNDAGLLGAAALFLD